MKNMTSSSTKDWNPIIGEEANNFFTHCVPQSASNSLKETSLSIMKKSIPPYILEGNETGLIVGYVQSGKTMSFESVAALSRDNKFQIIIVLAGKTNPLLEQSAGRLKTDLGLNDPKRARRWVHLHNPDSSPHTLELMKNIIDVWNDTEQPDIYKKTILITVLKHHSRINNLADLLSNVNLKRSASIIIDDEADQVSLNTEAAEEDESSTYNKLMKLRTTLPNHTYLQYTATPQAPLLINIIDSLSPNFVKVLEPGEDYIGEKVFFGDDYERYCRVIPSLEVPTKNNPLTEPPESLLEALRIFMIGVAIGIDESNDTGNRSMLVHPSHYTAQHLEFCGWVRAIFQAWKLCLEQDVGDPDRKYLIGEFFNSYNDLSKTIEQIPDFSVVCKNLKFAFANTQIVEVNAREGKTPAIEWQQNYGWILIGGNALDRGFTIEGLTVTYMPRGIGGGNADNIQQRARFFGYKKRYLGFCRVYLESETLDAFKHYVEHEEDIRLQLKRIELNNTPLNNWKRAFVLDSNLKPCRDSVLEFDYLYKNFKSGWTNPKFVYSSNDVISHNREVVSTFVAKHNFLDDIGHLERTETQKHGICETILLSDVLSDLLVGMRVISTIDAQKNIALLLQISRIIDKNKDEYCVVYNMSKGKIRTRSVTEDGEVLNIFQGAYPVEENKRGSIYPGDREIKSKEKVTIQIHNLELKFNNSTIATNVPTIAVMIPEEHAKIILSQTPQD